MLSAPLVDPKKREKTMGVDVNDDFIRCWNEILVPKWNRFRHLLSGNGKIHSDLASQYFPFKTGQKVLDIGCGYGETCLENSKKVGEKGEVLGIDCTQAFLDIADKEKNEAGVKNVRFELADAMTHKFPAEYFDVVFSRFGVMFFQNAVMALRNAHRALKPGGAVYLVVWRLLKENPAWCVAKEIALKYLPPPGDNAQTCGPGPFSWGNEETARAMLNAAGFENIEVFKRIDVDMCIGTSVEEAMDYQILVGPSGEIIREAGDKGQEKLPLIREELGSIFKKYLTKNGVYMPSSSWAIVARK
jgi:ubiquinone/menaquinone biosynthesis C-methylase UbiE